MYFWKYLASIMDNSEIKFDEFIESYYEEIKTISTNFNEKNLSCNKVFIFFYILLTFLLSTITLLIVVSNYYYPIIYWTKHKKNKTILFC